MFFRLMIDLLMMMTLLIPLIFELLAIPCMIITSRLTITQALCVCPLYNFALNCLSIRL